MRKSEAIAEQAKFLDIDKLELIRQYKEIDKSYKIIKFFKEGFTIKVNIINHGIDFGIFYIDIDFNKIMDYMINGFRFRLNCRGGKFKWISYTKCAHMHIYQEYSRRTTLSVCIGSTCEIMYKLIKNNKNIVSAIDCMIDLLNNTPLNAGKAFPYIKKCKICGDRSSKIYCRKCSEVLK